RARPRRRAQRVGGRTPPERPCCAAGPRPRPGPHDRGAGTAGAPSWGHAGAQHRRAHAPGEAAGDPQGGWEPATTLGLRGADFAGERAWRSGQHHTTADPIRPAELLACCAEVISRLVAEERAAPLASPVTVRLRGDSLRSGLLDTVQRVFGSAQNLVGIGAVSVGLGDTDADCHRYRLLGRAGSRRLPGSLGLGYRYFQARRFDHAPGGVEMTGSRLLRQALEDHRERLFTEVERPSSSSHLRERLCDEADTATGRLGLVGLAPCRRVVDSYARARVT